LLKTLGLSTKDFSCFPSMNAKRVTSYFFIFDVQFFKCNDTNASNRKIIKFPGLLRRFLYVTSVIFIT
jgi:hypothetical protein